MYFNSITFPQQQQKNLFLKAANQFVQTHDPQEDLSIE